MNFIRFLSLVLVILGSIVLSGFTHLNTEEEEISSSIPVLDMSEFRNIETRQHFINQLIKAAHEVGFFAVINHNVSTDLLRNVYGVAKEFFTSADELKQEIYSPIIHKTRGYLFLGERGRDFKEFLHIGRARNIWPSWIDLKLPLEELLLCLDQHSDDLQRALALAMGEAEEFFVPMTQSGENTLRVMYYSPPGEAETIWAAQHTDIDLFTILPLATEEGLEVFHEGKWMKVRIPENAFIINCGDKLQNLTNGYFKSCLHRVVSKPKADRYSIIYFVQPRSEDSMSPRSHCIEMTGGVQRYPNASSVALLSSRLREIGLASPELLELERTSGLLEQIKDLVEKGVAAEPVKQTYSLWLQSQQPK